MRKYLILTLLSALSLGAKGQDIDLSGLPQATTASSLRYWFDSETAIKTTTTMSGATIIDASGLLEGIHTVHYQIVDDAGVAGIPASNMFIKLDPRVVATAASLRYWFDSETTIKTTTTMSGATTIDASGLVEGIHTVHYQIVDNAGVAGIPASNMFIKLDPRVIATAASLRYWFNSETIVKTTTTLSGATIIDASGLVEGIHTVHYQIMDSKGVAGIPVSEMFIKLDPRVIATAESLRYWFDNDTDVQTTTTLSGATTIQTSSVADGIHTVHYQIVDSKGDAGVPVSKMFMKLGATVASKAIGIQYWFDENDALIKESDIKNLTTTVDASGLGKDEHVLHYQLKLSDGTLSPAASATFNTTQLLEGDANNDTKVNVADIVVIQIFISDNTKPIHGANADANGDGVVDEKDVEAVKDIIMTPEESKE